MMRCLGSAATPVQGDPMTTIAETLPAAERPVWRARLVVMLAGLAQAAAVYAQAAAPYWIEPAALDAAMVFVLSAGLVVQMTWPAAEAGWAIRQRSLGSAFCAALLVGLCHYWSIEAWGDVYFGPGRDAFLGLSLFLALPLLQGIVAVGFRPPAYERLFTRFVDTALTLLIGAISLGLYIVLRHLWASLFDALQIADISAFLRGDLFTSFTDAAAWTMGILITRESSGILDRLLRLCTALARGLLPVIVVIGASFFLALPFAGLEPLWREGGGSGLLLGIAAFAIFLVNGVYQAGERFYPAWQRRLVEAAILVLAAAAGLAIYGATLRVAQHGLTPERVHLLASAGLAGMAAAGYLGAVLASRRAWLSAVGRINSIALPTTVLLLIALTSPVLDPVGLSAWSQFRRLADGVVPVQQFDFGYLQFQLGEAGRERLAALEQLTDHPEAAELRERIAAVRQFGNYWQWKEAHGQVVARPPVPALPRRLISPAPATPAAQLALQRQRTALWGDQISGLAGQSVREVHGPFVVDGTATWRAGDAPRLYVVLSGYVSVERRRLVYQNGTDFALLNASPFAVRAGETITLKADSPAIVLIVELEPAR
jgi:hypothetical protein